MATPGVFVGREQELARLRGHLEKVLAGAGQVVLVSGDAGAGKSTLLAAFAAAAEAAHDDLIVVSGTCDPQTGPGDPYLPFQEVLEQLSGDEDSMAASGAVSRTMAGRLKRIGVAVGETLVDFAPDLIGVLVPGATLLAKLGKYVAGKSRWADKLRKTLETNASGPPRPLDASQVFEQYANVIKRLSEEAPLLLLIDDLQWADTASLGLLFRLSRRLEESRVLVVGAFRPSDVAMGRGGERHPLEQTLAELKRYRGDVVVDLDAATAERGREFIAELLGAEANELSHEFAEALYLHTGGRPLFAVEVLRTLQERGELVRGPGGSWTASGDLSWSMLPSRVEGVIEERLGRLDPDAARSLTIGSVEGTRFTVEVVAQVQPREARALVRELGETLQKRHRLVSADGVARLGGNRLSHYRFAHGQMQEYLYRSLDEVEASYLHEDVGNALEALYGDRAHEAALQLARHFDLGGVPDKARTYLRHAAEQAARTFANAAALTHYARALELGPDDEERFWLLAGRSEVSNRLARHDDVRADLDEMDELAARLDGPKVRAVALKRRVQLETKLGANASAVDHAEAAVAAAREAGDRKLEADVMGLWGRALTWLSRHEEAEERLLAALELAKQLGDLSLQGSCFTNLGIVADIGGDRAKARSYFEQAHATFMTTGDRDGTAGAVSNLSIVYWREGDLDAARRFCEESLVLNRQTGDLDGQAKSLGNLGLLLNEQGRFAEAEARTREALEVARDMGSAYNVARMLGILSSALAAQGDYEASRAASAEALELDLSVNDRQDACFHYQGLAEVALALGDLDTAAKRIGSGLALARAIGERDAERCLLHTKALLALKRGDPPGCLAVAEEGRALAAELGNAPGEAGALTLVGRASLALGDLQGARGAFTRATELVGERRCVDARVGLAQVALAEGDAAAALAALEPCAEALATTPLEGVEDRFHVFAAGHAVLQRAGDARAERVMANALAVVEEVAGRVRDEAERERFLERQGAGLLTR